MYQKFSFLCGNFENINFIYAIKCDQHPWHYFETLDTLLSEHDSLPGVLENIIKSLTKVRTVEINLNENQVKNYYEKGKFVFKDKELQTFMTLANKAPEKQQTKRKTTRELTFVSGQTNPVFFLDEFEKCHDLICDQDKMFKIRHFVDEEHRAEFSQLFFTGDWCATKTAFLTKYSPKFIGNVKRELNIDFKEEPSLRSFVHKKLLSLENYTTLPFVNQMEMVLSELPHEIYLIFMVNEMVKRDKTAILDFCDSIQDIIEQHNEANQNIEEVNEPLNRMEVFHYDPDFVAESEPEPMSQDRLPQQGRSAEPQSSQGRVLKRNTKPKRGPGRPRKILQTISEDDGSSGIEFLRELSDSSKSSWSSQL